MISNWKARVITQMHACTKSIQGKAFDPDWFLLLQLVNEANDEIIRLQAIERRIHDMMPLFTEARDALPAISLVAAKLHGVSLTLTDRMDGVGNPDHWQAMDVARAESSMTKQEI